MAAVRSSWMSVTLLLAALVLAPSLAAVEASHHAFADLQPLEADHVDDTLRTGFHFQPPRHWINDPNGVMYHNGVYHLFYQYNPKAAVWGNIVWAHAVSTDLVNWVLLDPAIYPTGPFDENGCWSGSATVLPDGTPVIMYTGIDADGRQVQNVAYPKDLTDPYLREWVKPDYNPVIAPDAGVNATAFRDPTTAWQGPDGVWRLVIGTKDNHRGFAALYRSRDFKHWAPARRALHSGDTGMWECPDFYPVTYSVGDGGGTKHVLKVSLDLTRFEYYTFGEYDHASDTYVPDAALADGNDGLRYDYGNFYASKTFLDPAKHRRVLWGWANESDSTAADVLKSWAGVQAIPRKIWLAPNGKQLLQWPVAEIESLRGNHVNITDTLVRGGGSYFEVTGLATPAQADVEASFQVMDVDKAEPFNPAWRGADAQTVCAARGADAKGGVGPFGLWVLASDELKERTAVFFSVFKRDTDGGGNKHVVLMCTDPSRSSYAEHLYKPTFAGFVDVDIAETGKIPLRTLIDHSVVESFGGHGKTAILSRVYPTMAVGDKARLFVFNNGESDVKVTSLNAYDMGSAKIRAET
ncbi:beta-fructofuranosidase, insoluble isoenzyme 3-like [Oryza brachyantha]|uniref:beta-fructofuranosidase, insoluble isoenzyme 3-like n=1 Tax=Oryza brachyantha TaxID=4533 RepID=UPI001AD97149|nr:beta-fructofuranosidase, insoluble isoenzyme 3-like [Oryza brachyantha]